jgi:hypothetical protein
LKLVGVHREKTLDSNVDRALKAAAEGNAALGTDSAGELKLFVRLEVPNRISYKPEEISFDSSGILRELKVTRAPVTQELEWRREQ